VEKLLHLGAKLLQKDRFGQPPIFLACKQGHDGIVSRVLESNSQQSTVTDHRGWTLFHWAAALGQVAMCKVLQQFGVDAMAVARGGHTPSLIAADQGDVVS
jgi:ankyrin repeat protein